MGFYYSDNPVTDFLRHDSEQQEQLENLPKCCECGEHIQQEDAVRFDDKYICDACLEDLRVELMQEVI